MIREMEWSKEERWFPGPDMRDGMGGVSVAVLGHQL